MIPVGVVRIICAIAPTAALRDAMLGDFREEYDARLRVSGHASARAWCWREALRSLGGTLWYSLPGRQAILTSIIPAVLWGYLIAATALMAALVLLLPLARLLMIPASHSMTWLLGLGPLALSATVLAGYEAARVGRRAPLWSSLALGLVFAAVSVRLHALVWYWPALTLLAPLGCVTGALLQQDQRHRLAWEATAES